MPEIWTLTLEKLDRYGREQVRTVNLTIDIRDFKDQAGFVWLLMAANPLLSISEIQEVLTNVGEQHKRPASWISRRRWIFHGKGKAGAKPNRDGLDEKAHKIMKANPSMSSRQLARMLRKKGIWRSAPWVMKNRVSGN